LAQSRKRRASRKRKRATGTATATPKPPGADETSRAERKNAEARAALEPLAEGERPGAVTVAAIVAVVFAVANLIVYFAGVEIRGDRPQLIGVLAYSGVMFAAGWGMWRVRYWAVLGMQALLGLLIVILSLVLLGSTDLLRAAIVLALVVAAGTLFWFLVKAMARIQMPERREG